MVFVNTKEIFKQEKLLIDIVFATNKKYLLAFSELPLICLC
jgi:hypothetical protein